MPKLLHTLRHPWRAVAAALLILGVPALAGAADFLEPEQAFQAVVRPADSPASLQLTLRAADGYYLYRNRISLTSEPADRIGPPALPAGEEKFDANFGETLRVLHGEQQAVVPVQTRGGAAAPSGFRLTVAYQGCADKGLCYAPMRQAFQVDPAANGWRITPVEADAQASLFALPGSAGAGQPEAGAAANPSKGTDPAAAAGPVPRDAQALQASPADSVGEALKSRSLLQVVLAFALAGLLLSFTPCVLPMVPILSSIIVGQSGGQPVSRAGGLALAAAYVLGMSLVYTAMGMAAGLAGEGLAATLQNPWVLGAFGLLMVGLALSMFGVYDLQVPAGLQGRLSEFTGRLKGGRFASVFAMGGVSALIVGPCVAAPLAGALVYISQTRDLWLGGAALFAMSLGMGVPLLLVGASAGTLLPRAGAWMERVKHVFGGLMLATAVWIVSPVLPPWALMGLVALLCLAAAAYIGTFDRLAETVGPVRRAAVRGIGGVLALAAVALVTGAASGGRDAWQPLAHLRPAATTTAGLEGSAGPGTASGRDDRAPPMLKVSDRAALERAIQASDKPVMVDFFAEWCTSCHEMERFTLSDPTVRQRLRDFTLLRVDVTANSPADRELMRRYGLFGPPALVFHPPAGPEQADARVIGFVKAGEFAAHLQRVGRSSNGS